MMFLKIIPPKKFVFLALLILFIGVGFCFAEKTFAFAGGDGSSGSPYQVASWADLNDVRNYLSSYFILTADLSSSTAGYAGVGNNWTPIGSSVSKFSGNFSGNNKTISDLVVSGSSNDVGLFGYVNTAHSIYDLGLLNVSISGGNSVGGLVGYQEAGTISNCHAAGTVTGSGDNIGGLVGYFIDGSISNSYATANVTSTAGDSVGGLVGYFIEGSVIDSYATGNVSATSGIGAVGGLIGYVVDGVNVTRCHHASGTVSGAGSGTGGLLGYVVDGNVYDSYTTGNVNSTGRDVGGLIGGMYDTVDHIISGSYSTGAVTASSYDVGGLVGILNTGSITDCYATGQITGLWGVGGLVGYQVEDTTTVTNSYATGNVIGTSLSNGGFGGLVGYKVDGTITNSYATGDVSGHDWVGGLAGDQDVGLITDSYATGDVTGTGDSVGGLVGWFDGNLTNSFSVGSVSGVSNVGGLLGLNYGSGTITNSFWDTQTSGQSSSAGGTGKTTAQMKTFSTYSVWNIVQDANNYNSGYPFLSWQKGASLYDWMFPQTSVLTSIVITPANRSMVIGEKITYYAEGFDQLGISMGNYTGSTTFTVNGSTSGWSGSTYTNSSAGTYTITGTNGSIVGTTSLTFTLPPPPIGAPPSHNECNAFEQCVLVLGAGADGCSINSDCLTCDPHGDINKDGKINIRDFSILMYYWKQTNPANKCADINKDGIVDLKDFSIMLYWWTK